MQNITKAKKKKQKQKTLELADTYRVDINMEYLDLDLVVIWLIKCIAITAGC